MKVLRFYRRRQGYGWTMGLFPYSEESLRRFMRDRRKVTQSIVSRLTLSGFPIHMEVYD